MFGWKRVSIIVGTIVLVFLGAQFLYLPEVAAQVRAALVRNMDEPARVPYFHSAVPTCPYLNQCYVAGPVVPAGKRLRVTRLQGYMQIGNIPEPGFNHSVFLDLNDVSHPLVAFVPDAFNGAYHGNTLAFIREVDFYFEAGSAPVLEVAQPVTQDSHNRLTIAGYLVDLLP